MSDSLFSKRVLSILTGISILSVALGTIVSNVYLSSFGLSDYAIIQARVLFTGIVCLTVFVLFGFFWLTLIDAANHGNNRIWQILLNGAVKPVLFANLLWTIFPLVDASDKMYGIGNIHIRASLISVTALVGVIGAFQLLAHVRDEYADKELRTHPLTLVFTIISIVAIAAGVLSSVILAANEGEFRNLLYFCGFLSFAFTMNEVGLWRQAKITESGETIHHGSIFARDPRSGMKSMDWIFWMTLYLLFTLIAIRMYSTDVYPFLPDSAGGNRPVPMSVVTTQDEKVQGNLIHRTSTELYFERNGTVYRYKTDEVREFHLKTPSQP